MATSSSLSVFLNLTTTTTLLLLLFLLLIPRASKARPLTPAESGQLDRFAMEVMRCGRIPALSLSLVGDGAVVYEQGYGTANPSTRAKATKDTVFCLGSSTQAFTSVLIATLLSYKENKTFDTPLHEILGSRVHLPGRHRTDLLNLNDVLGMRTGLSNMDIVATAMGMNRYRLIQNLRFAPEVKEFREENVFSEVLFPLAEDAARALGGDTWYKLMRQYIFNRLGMDSAGFVHVDARENSRLATPVHSYDGKPVPVPMDSFKGQEIVAAASSVCASASDMSRWIHFILNNGKDMNNEQIISEMALKSTFKSVQSRSNGGDPRTSGFMQPTIQVSYTRESNALGWIKGQYRGYSYVSQDGSLPGYESLTTILPTRNVGVFTAFTGDGGARAYAAKVLLNIFAVDLLLHGQPWFDQSSVCTIMDKMVDVTMASETRPTYLGRVSEPIRPLEEYEGTYRHFAFGDLTVRRNESGVLRLDYGELGHYILHPSQRNDTFIMHATPGPLWFTTHADEYRNKGPYLAIFGTRYNDPSRRIETVTIPHFARDMDPEFSKNPVLPRVYGDDMASRQCDACAALSTSVCLISASVLISALGFLR